ncbi:hypothetical protein BACCOPRO_02824, partial [Phocaeicola coprophilus DSM 18228 = JCM 13818]
MSNRAENYGKYHYICCVLQNKQAEGMPEFILLKNKSLCPYQKDLTRSIFRF